MAHDMHKMSSLLGAALFIADDALPQTPFLHAAWHLAAAVGVATCNKLLEQLQVQIIANLSKSLISPVELAADCYLLVYCITTRSLMVRLSSTGFTKHHISMYSFPFVGNYLIDDPISERPFYQQQCTYVKKFDVRSIIVADMCCFLCSWLKFWRGKQQYVSGLFSN